MGKRYLIDSNSIIDFCNGKLPSIGRKLLLSIKPEISIITNIELFANKNISTEEADLLKKFVEISVVHSIHTDLIETTIAVRQTYKIKLPDALIAATAICYNCTLISHNTKDFKNIKGLNVIDPYLA